MNDQGSSGPPDLPAGTHEGDWEPVQRPEAELPASTGQPFPPLPPPPPASELPPPPYPVQPPQQPGPHDYRETYSGAAGVPPPNASTPPPPGGYPPPAYSTQAPMRPTTAAALAYLTFIPAIIFLLVEPYRRDPLVRFHAIQELLLTAVWIVARLLLGHHGWILGLMHVFVWLLLFAGWVVGIITASRGQRYPLPVLGELAEKLSDSL